MVTIARRVATILTTKLAKTAGAFALLLALLLATPLTASANAYGYAFWGAFPVDVKAAYKGVEVSTQVQIPKGKLGHGIVGKGLSIYSDEAYFETVGGNICDYSIRFTYGYGAYEYKTPISGNCNRYGGWKVTYGGWKAPGGDACAELWAKDWRVKIATQCHYVQP